MDLWRTLALTFGGLWVVTTGLLVWQLTATPTVSPTEAPDLDAPQARSDRAAPRSTSTRASRFERDDAPTRDVPALDLPSDGSVPGWVTDESAELPEAVMHRAREQMRQERMGIREERRGEMRDAIDSFAEDEGLSTEDADRLHGAFDAFEDQMADVRAKMESGDFERGDLRDSFRDAREQLRDTIIDVVGEEGADRLREQMPGPMGGGRPVGFGGPPGPPPPL